VISRFLTRQPGKGRKKRLVSDPQRRKLYYMERHFDGMTIKHHAERQHLLDIRDHVCKYYGLEPIKLYIVDRKPPEEGHDDLGWTTTTYEDESCALYLNRAWYGDNAQTLLHELAHYVTDSHYEDHQTHGGQFCAIYMHLLDKYKMLPSDAFRVLAKRFGVRIAHRFRPSAIR